MELARRQIARQAAATRTAFSNFGAASDRTWNASWLALTVVLGLSFLAGQWTAWRELAARGFYVSTNPSSSFFYLLTGTHGVHLFGGVLALLVAVVAALLRRPIESRLVILDVTGWYWHFMAVLWIYILFLLKFVR
jgi:cytochrome c oxidase subunit 3